VSLTGTCRRVPICSAMISSAATILRTDTFGSAATRASLTGPACSRDHSRFPRIDDIPGYERRLASDACLQPHANGGVTIAGDNQQTGQRERDCPAVEVCKVFSVSMELAVRHVQVGIRWGLPVTGSVISEKLVVEVDRLLVGRVIWRVV
jgi:hypothetical protein